VTDFDSSDERYDEGSITTTGKLIHLQTEPKMDRLAA